MDKHVGYVNVNTLYNFYPNFYVVMARVMRSIFSVKLKKKKQ